VLAAVIAACWLLGVAMVAMATGYERSAAFSRGLAPDADAPGTVPEPDRPGAEPSSRAVPAGLGELETIRFTAAILAPKRLEGVAPALAGARAAEWAKAVEAGGVDALDAIGEILPPALWFQARLVTRRDEDSVRADATAGGAYGKAYAELRGALAATKASAGAVEAAIGEIWRRSASTPSPESAKSSVLKRSDRWVPGNSALKASHQYALDVFFTSLKRHGSEETGPAIRSISGGIVVAAASDWLGGDRPSLYRSGGLSPKAGNGAIVYDPEEGRYYAYFHMSEVSARVGQVVAAGAVLGRGGNTGVNARKKGHGGHVHVEIHDADSGAWTAYRIRDLILSSR